jgi:carboxypeptidase Q
MRTLVALLILAVVIRAEEPDIRTAVDATLLAEIKSRGEIMPNLAHLCDSIGPRLTTSPSLEAANKWALEKMKSYGLTNVRLEPWEAPIGWTRGTATMTLTTPVAKAMTVCSAGWCPGTPGSVIGTVVYFDAKTKADLDAFKGKLKGAVLLRGKPAKVAPVSDTNYGRDRRPNISSPPAKDATPKDPAKPPTEEERKEFDAVQEQLKEFFAAEGVACTLRDSGKPHGLLITTGGFKDDADRVTAKNPTPSLFVTHEDYAMLYRLWEAKQEPTVTLNISNTFSEGPVTVYNTIGEIVGSQMPEEIVVLGAHLDSWDLARGTTDNGTGSCVILEAARALSALAKAGHAPKRTIRFCLFTGEEQGLHGSKAYVKRHQSTLDKHSAALVHDTGTGKVLAFHLMGREAVKAVLDPELISLKGIGFEGVATTSSGGTDHLPFEKAGVPGFPCKQDWDEYRFTHHTQSDTFDKAKPENLVQGAQVLSVAALRIDGGAIAGPDRDLLRHTLGVTIADGFDFHRVCVFLPAWQHRRFEIVSGLLHVVHVERCPGGYFYNDAGPVAGRFRLGQARRAGSGFEHVRFGHRLRGCHRRAVRDAVLELQRTQLPRGDLQALLLGERAAVAVVLDLESVSELLAGREIRADERSLAAGEVERPPFSEKFGIGGELDDDRGPIG